MQLLPLSCVIIRPEDLKPTLRIPNNSQQCSTPQSEIVQTRQNITVPKKIVRRKLKLNPNTTRSPVVATIHSERPTRYLKLLRRVKTITFPIKSMKKIDIFGIRSILRFSLDSPAEWG